MAEIQHNSHVKIIRSDNGPEFLTPQFYASKEILQQIGCVESPQQNGSMEIKHQHILNIARAIIFQASVPKSFWAYEVSHAIYIMNIVTNPILNNKSPYCLLFKEEPDLHALKIFGTLTYASILQSLRTKLDHRGRKCIFLGFKQGVKGAILLDIKNKDIFISINIVHYEHIFPYHPNWKCHKCPNNETPTSDMSFFPQQFQIH